MHILVIGTNYTPEKIGIGAKTAELCEYMVSQGQRVSVVTSFPHYPEWKIYGPYRRKAFMRETINNVSVYRVCNFIPRNPANAFQRISYDLTFTATSFLCGLAIPKVDVILNVSPPLEAGLAGCILSKLKKARFALQIYDVVPDLAITLGILKNPLIIGLARRLERFLYRKSQAILTVCGGFLGNLKSKGVYGEKVKLIPMWVDTKRIRPLERNNRFRKEHNLGDKFIVLYCGNISTKQRLEQVIECAKDLRNMKDMLFLFVGDGPRKAHLEKISLNMSNTAFMPLQAKEAFPYMLAAADVLLLSQNPKVVDMVIPCKLLNYMAAGRPVIASVNKESEAANYVRMARCGLIADPDNPGSLAEGIRSLYADRKAAARLGKNGRAFAQANFSKNRIFKDYLNFFNNFLKDEKR